MFEWVLLIDKVSTLYHGCLTFEKQSDYDVKLIKKVLTHSNFFTNTRNLGNTYTRENY